MTFDYASSFFPMICKAPCEIRDHGDSLLLKLMVLQFYNHLINQDLRLRDFILNYKVAFVFKKTFARRSKRNHLENSGDKNPILASKSSIFVFVWFVRISFVVKKGGGELNVRNHQVKILLTSPVLYSAISSFFFPHTSCSILVILVLFKFISHAKALVAQSCLTPLQPPKRIPQKLRHLLLGRKAMTNLDSILKSRDITLPTKVHLVQLQLFQQSCMDVRVGL